MLMAPVWASVGTLLINDHWGKGHLPAWLSGKLSDFAGMLFFPLFLLSLWEFSRHRVASRRALIVCVCATGVTFALVKTTALFHALYGFTWALFQWPFHAIRAALSSRASP